MKNYEVEIRTGRIGKTDYHGDLAAVLSFDRDAFTRRDMDIIYRAMDVQMVDRTLDWVRAEVHIDGEYAFMASMYRKFFAEIHWMFMDVIYFGQALNIRTYKEVA